MRFLIAFASDLQLGCNIFRQPSTKHTIKGNYVNLQTIDLEIRSILIFQKRVREITSPPHFVYDFSRKIFLLLYDQISLSDSLYFLRYWVICVLQLFVFRGCDVMDFENNLTFLINPFFYMTKYSRQKFKYLGNKKSF